jgi:ubiquitin carboxyl-terminal hydrolase 22/27/51
LGQILIHLDSRKRKLNAIYPTGEEDKFVLPNSNALSCQAGSPRGIYNMGQTCYLSVILQAMIHNPMMRNYFLSSRHDTTECEIDNCVICALTISFSDILATEKLDGHGPVDLLYRSWKHNTVSFTLFFIFIFIFELK